MRVFLVRHGQTAWNAKHRIQGQVNIPLSEEGRRQAHEAGTALRTIAFDAALSSPLDRAYETAGILCQGRSIQPEKDPALLEMSFGVKEGQWLPLITRFPFTKMHNLFVNPEQYIPPRKAESYEQLFTRCRHILHNLLQPLETEHQTVLVVAHGTLIRGITAQITNRPLKDFWNGPYHGNCSVTILEVTDGEWRLLCEGIPPAEIPDLPSL